MFIVSGARVSLHTLHADGKERKKGEAHVHRVPDFVRENLVGLV